MFCVIQEIETKKQNKNGYAKELKSSYMQMSFNGEDMGHYYYFYGEEKFDRPIMKAYRISIHISYREDGMVKKKQYALCTVNYYDFAEGLFSAYDYCSSKIKKIADELRADEGELYQIIEEKTGLLAERIRSEFLETEEYRTHQEHIGIINEHNRRRDKFMSKYKASGDEYDKCYDVFGELKNPEYLEKVKSEYKRRIKYEEESRSYQEEFYSNYSKYFKGSSSISRAETDKDILKQFYRLLSKKFHPDANPDTDTSREMQVLNQLKSEWGV